uniref:C2H2-type domain-containing protein n=1 Tax=viral metagenome TaxID=1070528 RepID=A0A6C0IET2_9ZZZZ
MIVNDSEKLQKVAFKFSCLKCDYYTCRKSSFEKHLTTDKHKMVVNGSEKLQKVAQYICNCGKSYKFDSGYYRHKKQCQEINNDLLSEKELIMTLVKQNSEMLEVIKNGTHNTTNSHNNNKTFNLNFFLNETCKDAMNITDFVDSIKLQLSDLEKVGDVGYIEGISDIITTNLKALDITQRPIHCTDKKREVLYVKDEDKWEKEDEEKKRVRKAIKNVADKNSRLLLKFREVHPDCNKSNSKYSDQYNKIIVEAFGGQGNNVMDKEDKIIKNISKNVIINRD